MRECKVEKKDAEQRLDKYLKKMFVNASVGFLYKMLRKKNITLNGKKAEGKEVLRADDTIQVYFSDETFGKLQGQAENNARFLELSQIDSSRLDILFENEMILAVNKPAGILSQKADENDISMNEQIISYLIRHKEVTEESFALFHPSVANRLDRNTTGILLAGKTLGGQQYLARILKERTLMKEYRCIVGGKVLRAEKKSGFLWKDERANRVALLSAMKPGARYIETEYTPLAYGEDCTLLSVHLITGRSHQIRAHLASMGYPVIGDFKYGDFTLNRKYDKLFHVKHQLLHAYRIILPDKTVIVAPYPNVFEALVKKMKEVH